MTEVVVFPDVVAWATSCIATGLAANGYADVVVDDRYNGASKAVWVRRDGGPQLDHFREAARLAVNVLVKASSDKPANDLARLVSALLRAGADGTPVLNVTQTSGPSPIPDAAGPHVYLTFEAQVRGTPL